MSILGILPHHKRQGLEFLSIPELINFNDNYVETALFFDYFRKIIYKSDTKFYISFRSLKKIGPCAALALVAELDRYRRLTQWRVRFYDYAKLDPDVRRLLVEMGLTELLEAIVPGVGRVSHLSTSENSPLRLIRFRSGNLTRGDLTVPIKDGIESVAGPIPGGLWPRIYGSLTEAMKNAIEHAYIEPQIGSAYPAPPIMKQWWMSGSFDVATREMKLIFLDHGLSIPYTLPRYRWRDRLREYLGLTADTAGDGHLIHAATQIGATSTKRKERGKGLPEMRSLVERQGNGRLRILSRRGEYVFSPGESEKATERAVAVGGTLIEWQLIPPKL